MNRMEPLCADLRISLGRCMVGGSGRVVEPTRPVPHRSFRRQPWVVVGQEKRQTNFGAREGTMPDNTIQTSRFGTLQVEPDDVIEFPRGILGMEHLREWVLFADAQNAQLGWLQSTQQPEVALAVVSPRRFVPDYQVRVARRELESLKLEKADDAHVLAIVNQNDRYITLNLKAPLVINLSHRVGCQVVAKGNQPIQHELSCRTEPLKQSA